jgi:hypothetical protein
VGICACLFERVCVLWCIFKEGGEGGREGGREALSVVSFEIKRERGR